MTSTLTPTDTLTPSEATHSRPEVLSLRTQLVREGYTRTLLTQTDLMHLHIMSYGPKSGENTLHSHNDEDHGFLVLSGEATFVGQDRIPEIVKKNQVIFLPKNTYYAFSNDTDGALVMLRFGASRTLPQDRQRLDKNSQPVAGRPQPAGGTVLIDGAFFE